jgi:UDP-N-acetylmuramoylalanine--D-glutamate ligase
MDFTGKKVVVMGLGTLGGGVGTARFFAKKGARVVVTDLKSREELKTSVEELSQYPIEYILGNHREEDFIKADLIIKNPSVPSSSPFIELARKNNIRVEMAESLFMELSPTKNIIGVTGTRGKSTTSQMIYEIIKTAGRKVVLGGNVKGIATLELLGAIDDSYYVVLELSSWMLEGFGWNKVSPWISVITNIYPDHLNRYKGMDEYINDKKNIYKFQKKDDILILNKDDKTSQNFASEAPGR